MAEQSPSGRRVTRRDVARLAGVSDAVVSYTLSGKAPVARATAERVLQAVRMLNYRPNVFARALRSGSARALTLITPYGVDPFFAELGHAIESAARHRGYALYTTTASADDPVTLQRFRDLADRQVDGILVVPVGQTLDAEALDEVGVPWAVVAGSAPLRGARTVRTDLWAGARAAVEHLVKVHQHAAVGYLGPTVTAEDRYRSWRSAADEFGIDATPAVSTEFSREGGFRAGRALLAGTLPTAVFCASDMIAEGVLLALHEAGVAVPDQVAVIGFNDSSASAFTWPPLTTVRQDVDAIAAAALDLVLPDQADPIVGGSGGEDGGVASVGTVRAHVASAGLITTAASLVVRRTCGCSRSV